MSLLRKAETFTALQRCMAEMRSLRKYLNFINIIITKKLEESKKDITFIDPIVEQVARKLALRSVMGYAKYGTTLDKNDNPLDYWLANLQEELMDAANYIEKTRTVLKQIDNGKTKKE